MTSTSLPTAKDIDELVTYLPTFEAEGFDPIVDWGVRAPNYKPIVDEFFYKSGHVVWMDSDYSLAERKRMIEDAEFIKTATLAQCRAMLAFCVRGERYTDGHWGVAIRDGYIQRVLRRLQEIRAAM